MNTEHETISLYRFFEMFPNEEASRLHFEEKRWGKDGVKRTCPHCGSKETVETKNHKPMPYRCKSCRKHFSVKTNTILGSSPIPLHKWLMAIYMMTTARKGIPSTQFAKMLDLTQKSAWFLAQRIRQAWLNNSDNVDKDIMGNHVQVDETYIGGKETNKHANKKLRAGRGAVGKAPVIGMRGEAGNVSAKHTPNTKKTTLHAFIESHVKTGSVVVTDEWRGYRGLKNKGYIHLSVNHSVGEYVREQAHTNGIESFWALLKRGYYGIYHSMSRKHLNRYVHEFSFRHNTRNLGTLAFIGQTIGMMFEKRITYKELIHV